MDTKLISKKHTKIATTSIIAKSFCIILFLCSCGNLLPGSGAISSSGVGSKLVTSDSDCDGYKKNSLDFWIGYQKQNSKSSLNLEQLNPSGSIQSFDFFETKDKFTLVKVNNNLRRLLIRLTPGIELHPKMISGSPVPSGLTLDGQHRVAHRTYSSSYKGMGFCKNYLEIHDLANGQQLIFDKLPTQLTTEDLELAYQSLSHINRPDLPRLMDSVSTFEPTQKWLEGLPCFFYHPENKKIEVALNFTFTNSHYKGYQVYWSTEKQAPIEVNPLFFDVTASSSGESGLLYALNKVPKQSTNTVLTSFPTNGFTSTGLLCTDRFWVEVSPNTPRAINKDHNFLYPNPSVEFEQGSVVAFATLHTKWIQTLNPSGQSWLGPQIRIVFLGSAQSPTNDSFYNGQPTADQFPTDQFPNGSDTSDQPTVFLGIGDGKNYQKFRYDEDVISHELGHHVVYRKLTTTSGESLTLHEGCADYFDEARLNSSCLGELICPATSTACVSAHCLRDASNKYTWSTIGTMAEGHKKSQIVSGTLWDIGTQITQTAMAKILYTAVDYFPSDAGYVEFFMALMSADLQLNKGVNACAMETVFRSRGFGPQLDAQKVSCKNYLPKS